MVKAYGSTELLKVAISQVQLDIMSSSVQSIDAYIGFQRQIYSPSN